MATVFYFRLDKPDFPRQTFLELAVLYLLNDSFVVSAAYKVQIFHFYYFPQEDDSFLVISAVGLIRKDDDDEFF